MSQQNIKSLLKYLNQLDSDLKFSPETPLTVIWEQCCDFLQSRTQEGKSYPELEELIDRVTPLFISDEVKPLTDAIADLTIPSQSRLYNNVDNSSVLIQPSILQVIVDLANEYRRNSTLTIYLRHSQDSILIDTNSKGVGFSEKGKFVGHPVLAFLENFFVEHSANYNRGETYQIVAESNTP